MSERGGASPARPPSARRERSRREAPSGAAQPPRRARSRSAETRAALNAAITAAQRELEASLARRILSSLACGAPRRQLVDDYTETGAILGRGAFSFVLAVQRRGSGKPFAAKCVHSQGMAVAERREALRSALAEAVTLAKLRHPGVVALYDVVLERKRACLLLERCEGGTLLTLVQGRVNESKARMARERRAGSTANGGTGPNLGVVVNLLGASRDPPPPYCLSEAEARAGLRAAAEALRYVHDRGFVHRDVKLENLLMAAPLNLGTLKLADFGFATTTARPGAGPPRAPDKGLQGTVEYAAPEILAAYRGQRAKGGTAEADAEAAARPAVDMWSLGVTLFLMLGGYHLFDTSRESEEARRAPGPRLDAEFQRAPWAAVSGTARDLVRALLAAPPAERLSAPAVLAHEWLQAGPEQPMVRAPVAPPPAAAPSARSRARGGSAPAGAALPRREATYGVPTPPHRERSASSRTAAASPPRAGKG